MVHGSVGAGHRAEERGATCRVASTASVPVIRLGVLQAARVDADAGAVAINVVPVATMNGMGMATMLRAKTLGMANTHSVFANAHDDVHGWFRKVGTYS